MNKIETLKNMVRIVEDFPVSGISYKDITTVIHSAEGFKMAVELLAEQLDGIKFDYLIGPEARGFIFGSPLAVHMGKGFVPVRKKGKLPYETASYRYDLEYGSDEIFVHRDAVNAGERFVIVDDLLATGGTARAVAELVRELGGEVVGFVSLIELDDLGGRKRLGDIPVRTLIHYEH